MFDAGVPGVDEGNEGAAKVLSQVDGPRVRAGSEGEGETDVKELLKWVDESERFGLQSQTTVPVPTPSVMDTTTTAMSTNAMSTNIMSTALSTSLHSSPEIDTKLESVRKRLEKRKFRPIEMPAEVQKKSDKKLRNTMAARRYRQRQRHDIEVLDARIKQLEEELVGAKLEAKWWQMEANRWESQAKDK